MNDNIQIFVLKTIAKMCPKALETYITLWENRDHNSRYRSDVRDVAEKLLISKAKFNHHLRELASAGVIQYDKDEKSIYVALI